MNLLPYGLIYLAAPYSATKDGQEDMVKINERMDLFCRCIEKMIQERVAVISPLMMHMVRERSQKPLPGDWGYWQSYSLELLGRSDTLVVLTMDEWDLSTGVRGEIAAAHDHGIKVIYLDPVEYLKPV